MKPVKRSRVEASIADLPGAGLHVVELPSENLKVRKRCIPDEEDENGEYQRFKRWARAAVDEEPEGA